MRVRPPAFRLGYADCCLKMDLATGGSTEFDWAAALSHGQGSADLAGFREASRQNGRLHNPSVAFELSADVGLFDPHGIRGLDQNWTPRAHWRDRRAPGRHASEKCCTVPAK